METFLSYTEVAALIGVKPGGLSRYALPEADVQVGRTRGWRRETIETWNAARPGRGARTDLHPRTGRE